MKNVIKGVNHLYMPNKRKQDTKLAGAYIENKKNVLLHKLAVEKGFENKAAYLRYLYDQALIKAGLLKILDHVGHESLNF